MTSLKLYELKELKLRKVMQIDFFTVAHISNTCHNFEKLSFLKLFLINVTKILIFILQLMEHISYLFREMYV